MPATQMTGGGTAGGGAAEGPAAPGDQMLAAVAALLQERGAEGWLVGGSVRDRLLGRYSPDMDVVVAGDAGVVARDVARALDVPWFTLSAEHEAYRVVGAAAHVDVSAVRGGHIFADLAERDFTMNAMAVSLKAARAWGVDSDLIDPFGGLAHLRDRRLVAVSDHIFADDPLRLMRAARFGHTLGMRLDTELESAVRSQAGEVRRAAPERVATEIILTLAAGRAGDAVRLWDGLGLLREVVPELDPAVGQTPDRTFALLDSLEGLLSNLQTWFPEAASPLERRLHEPVDGAAARDVALRLAGLLRGLTPRLALAVGRRLRLSSALASLLEAAARMKDRPEEPSPVLGGREAVLCLWEAAPWEPEMIILAAAASTLGPQGAPPAVAQKLMSLWALRAADGVPRLPFDGIELMKELDLPPGPSLGAALRAARLAWEAGEATTAQEALQAARTAVGGS
jgi:tRNA nucleotidyltransferase/poly(A) polymerase